jgi:hypothetical protein
MFRPGPLVWAVSALVVTAATAGCATAPAGPTQPDAPPPEQAAAYYPFSPGWRWAYDVQREGEASMIATTAVEMATEDSAIVQSGEQRLSYALMPEGIARRDGLRTTDFLLRTPIRAGASWPIEGGEARVTTVGKVVTVPGGTFGNCATVEESRTNPRRITRTVYCAGVGPVSVEIQVHDPLSGAFKSEMRATLLGLTRPGQDPLGAAEGTSGPPPRR